MKTCKIIIFLLIVSLSLSINQRCTYTDVLNKGNDTCPQNASCRPNNYCACNNGYIGNCSQKAYTMENNVQITAQLNNTDYTFFSVSSSVDYYVILIFDLCHKQSSDNLELINVWDDNGQIQVFNNSNVLPGGKNWQIKSGCFVLVTPLMQFTSQPNGQPDNFILGLKLLNPGSVQIDLTVEIGTFDFWDLLYKFLFIIGSIFGFLIIATIAVFIYRWKRRNQAQRALLVSNDISYFDQYMPKFVLNSSTKRQLTQQVCSVCLIDFCEGQTLRKTTCQHIFHHQCLDAWCKQHLNCPICRNPLDLTSLRVRTSRNELICNFSQIQQDSRRPLL